MRCAHIHSCVRDTPGITTAPSAIGEIRATIVRHDYCLASIVSRRPGRRLYFIGRLRTHTRRRRKRDTRGSSSSSIIRPRRECRRFSLFPGIPRLRAPAVPGNYAISIIIRAAINELEALSAGLTFIAHESLEG